MSNDEIFKEKMKEFKKVMAKGNYKSPSKLNEGENRLRVVSMPILGWLYWKEEANDKGEIKKKPIRSRVGEKPHGIKELDRFMTLYVWDYKAEDLFVMEITQASIMDALDTYGNDADFGNYMNYDIKIVKSGSGMETRYQVMALPPKPLDPKISEALENKPVRLEALYDSGDPWTDLEATVKESVIVQKLSEQQVSFIKAWYVEFPDLEVKMKERYKTDVIEDFPMEAYEKAKKHVEKRAKQ